MRWMPPAFGLIWWATTVRPDNYHNVSSAFGIRPPTAETLTSEEAADFALFRDPKSAKTYSKDACRNGHCAEPDEGEQTVCKYTINRHKPPAQLDWFSGRFMRDCL